MQIAVIFSRNCPVYMPRLPKYFHKENNMNKFDTIYFELMGESRRGKQFDDLNLQQVGLDKGSYLAQPASKPVKREPEPKLIECPHCLKKFYNVNGCQDA
jgi:hypothetical protein